MKLKIRIKENTEEQKGLTLGERAIISVVTSSRIYDRYNSHFVIECQKHLESLGYISNDGKTGIFRKETFRDATDDEENAWIYLFKHRRYAEDATSFAIAWDIPNGTYVESMNLKRANGMLAGKEIILEVIE